MPEPNTIFGRPPSRLLHRLGNILGPNPLKHDPLLGSDFDRSFERSDDALHTDLYIVGPIRSPFDKKWLLDHERRHARSNGE